MEFMKPLSVGEILSLFPPLMAALVSIVGNIYLVVKWLSKFSANKRVKLLNYYNEYNSLPREESGEITKNFIIRKIKNSINFEITKLKDEYFSKVFMFIVLSSQGRIDSFLLKRVIGFVNIEDKLVSVNFTKLKRENRNSICIASISFVLMLVFLCLLFLINYYYLYINFNLIEIYLGSLVIMSETFGLIYLSKYNRVKPIKKLNNTLAEIDASVFKPD